MQYNNTKDTKELLLIFSSDSYSIENEDLKISLEKVARYYDKFTRHQYHIISRYVNELLRESEDSISYILNNIDGMLAFLKYNEEECSGIIVDISETRLNIDDIILDLEKLYDHIALEEERIKTNGVMMRNGNQEIEENVVRTFNSIMDRFQSKVDEISNSLNANIITVVGLFSAIIFVFFGGITSLSDMINGIWKIRTKEDLTIPLIFILVIGFIIFNVVFLLLYSISKIVDKNIGSVVSFRNERWYWVEEIREGCYGIFYGDEQIGKCFKSQEKAKKVARRKRLVSCWKANFQQTGKKVFLRFPYVTCINTLLILSIIYLFLQL